MCKRCVLKNNTIKEVTLINIICLKTIIIQFKFTRLWCQAWSKFWATSAFGDKTALTPDDDGRTCTPAAMELNSHFKSIGVCTQKNTTISKKPCSGIFLCYAVTSLNFLSNNKFWNPLAKKWERLWNLTRQKKFLYALFWVVLSPAFLEQLSKFRFCLRYGSCDDTVLQEGY